MRVFNLDFYLVFYSEIQYISKVFTQLNTYIFEGSQRRIIYEKERFERNL
jgi:hypothetical protein